MTTSRLVVKELELRQQHLKHQVVDEETWESKVTSIIFDMIKVKKPLFIKFDSSLTTSQRQFLHELAEINDLFHETTGTRYKRLKIYLKTDLHDSKAKRLNLGNGYLRSEQILNINLCSASPVEIQQHDNITTVLNQVINNDLPKRRTKKNAESKVTQIQQINSPKSYSLRQRKT